MNKYPPAEPVAFHFRTVSPNTTSGAQAALMTTRQSCDCYLLPVNGSSKSSMLIWLISLSCFNCVAMYSFIALVFFCILVQTPHDTCNSTLYVLNFLRHPFGCPPFDFCVATARSQLHYIKRSFLFQSSSLKLFFTRGLSAGFIIQQKGRPLAPFYFRATGRTCKERSEGTAIVRRRRNRVTLFR